jgi:hypothetical protein
MSSQGSVGVTGYVYPITRDAQDWTRKLKEERAHKSYENVGGGNNTDTSPPWLKFGNGFRLIYNRGEISCGCQAGCYGNAFNGVVPSTNNVG